MTSVGQTIKTKQLRGSKKGSKAARQPHKYQERGVEFFCSHGGSAGLITPGGGKTAIAMRATLAIKDAKVGERALVIAPLRACYKVWPCEAAEWAGSRWDRLQELEVVVLHGDQKDLRLQQYADLYVINPDGLKWLFADAIAAAKARVEEAARQGRKVPMRFEVEDYERFNALGIDTLIIDESTLFKHRNTNRFQMLRPLLPEFKRRWILTGTPTPNGYMDLFGQYYIVDLGHSLGKYITHFRTQYFTPLDRNGWTWALKPGADKKIEKAIANCTFILDADDYLELPEYVDNIIRIDLPKEARRVYDKMEEDLIVQLENDEEVMAASTGVAAMKCAQIANGGLYHHQELSKAREWTNLHDEKVKAVEEIMDELRGSPALIVYEFKHDLERLQKALKLPYIGGGVSANESSRLIDLWNRDALPGLLVHPQAMAHALNLQHGSACTIIWHSIIYDRELYDQLNRRLRRQGSKQKNIFLHHIVARDTTDEARMQALKRKGKVQTNFLEALKEYARKRK